MDWLVWLVAGGVLGVAELATLTFVLGMLGVAAFTAAAAAGLGASAPVQVLVAAAVAVVLLAGVLPIARRHRRAPALRTGVTALVGSSGVALTDVDGDGGRVKLGGEEWSARSYGEGVAIPSGDRVDVVAIDGATALVVPH